MTLKRIFDFIFALIALLLCGGIMLFIYVGASLDTSSNGLFFQTRIGQFGRSFTIIKFKTFHSQSRKVTRFGHFLRATKLDELPQLWNVLVGEMSVVGPRPDVPGYYDRLEGDARKILALKPGLTCEASLKYAHEEVLLASKEDPLVYNDTVIFPDKVRMNLAYYYERTFWGDVIIVWKTVLRSF